MPERQPSGLRERKKLRTRVTLIETAAELCERQGFDNTTVEQIAAAADVSPRTFSRYFPTKEAVIFAIIEDTAAFVADELQRLPTDITEFEAMLRAHLKAVQPGRDGRPTPIFHRMAALIRIVNSSASLAVTNIPYRAQQDQFPTVIAVAKRMGLPKDHDAVHMVLETWTALMNSATRGLGTPGNPPIEPEIVAARISAAYETLTRTWRPWTAASESTDPRTGEPPASAPDC
ncbi:MAG: TetR/AcrR family transcriptional regulator [Mycolicibacterium sp.]|nr:TetR/AcrR family transcriptional regulator [Mycolicibacterium sp.]